MAVYKLVFFVPASHKEAVKEAVFNAGAGRIGNYDQCCWECKGSGQFRPQPGANPFIGTDKKLEFVEEFRVEMVCEDAIVKAAVTALKLAHPYEEPAYDLWKLECV
nr:NGG1p interacting factor NIF3 [Ketobacter sp. MCCC 1A13808]